MPSSSDPRERDLGYVVGFELVPTYAVPRRPRVLGRHHQLPRARALARDGPSLHHRGVAAKFGILGEPLTTWKPPDRSPPLVGLDGPAHVKGAPTSRSYTGARWSGRASCRLSRR